MIRETLPSETQLLDSAEDQALPRVYRFDPLKDLRWSEFLLEHPRASVFHSTQWLKSILATFGHQSFVVTTTPPGEKLQNALVYCRVQSWLTGHRAVSLPFSDHCDPLVTKPQDSLALITALRSELVRDRLDFVQLRPLHPFDLNNASPQSTESYCFHQIDLRADIETVFQGFHKSSIQRVIRRAEREGLQYVEGQSQSILASFEKLMISMRRRHGVLPHPRKWFRSLVDCFGESLKIRLAVHGGTPIAAILTLRFKDSLVYKYGCTDPDFHRFGGMQLLFWRSIQEAKQEGLRVFDLGRSDQDDTGLITFKERWGAERSILNYYKWTLSKQSQHSATSRGKRLKHNLVKPIITIAPERILSSMSDAVCKHLG